MRGNVGQKPGAHPGRLQDAPPRGGCDRRRAQPPDLVYQGFLARPRHDPAPARALPPTPGLQRHRKVRIDVLKRFGYYSTESNGHLSEYLPWYRKRPQEIGQWIDLSSWINGETGGYLRVCTEGRSWFETDFPNWLKEPAPKIGPDNRSEEHGSWIIESLVTGRTYRG